MKRMLLAPAVAAMLLLSGCATEEPKEADKKTEAPATQETEAPVEHNIVPEDEPKEVNAAEHSADMNKALKPFAPVEEHTDKWLQIAQDNETFFAVTDPETAQAVTKTLTSVKGWSLNSGDLDKNNYTGMIVTEAGKALYIGATDNAQEGTIAFVFTVQGDN